MHKLKFSSRQLSRTNCSRVFGLVTTCALTTGCVAYDVSAPQETDEEPNALAASAALTVLGDGSAVQSSVTTTAVSDMNWRVGGVADFNQDGVSDILWRNHATGQNVIWYMGGTNGSTCISTSSPPAVTDLNWRIGGVADFNRDGVPDILWRNYVTGQNDIWAMGGTDGSTRVSSSSAIAQTDLSWYVGGVADFNRDGVPDILWRHRASGQNLIWNMGGAGGSTYLSTSSVSAVTDLNWDIEGAADANRDGAPDILWRNHVTGQNLIWPMGGANGATRTGTYYPLAVSDLNWHMRGTGDFNRDGQPDILWRNDASGQNDIWYMRPAISPAVDWDNNTAVIAAFQPEWRFSYLHQCWPLNAAAGETNPDACKGSFDPNFTVFARVTRMPGTSRTMRIAYSVAFGWQNFPYASHGNDVEVVVVDIVDGTLTSVRYNVHRGAYVKMASEIQVVDGTHPVVYTGAAGHASYHDTDKSYEILCTLADPIICNFGDNRGNDYRSRGRVVNLGAPQTNPGITAVGYAWTNAPWTKKEFGLGVSAVDSYQYLYGQFGASTAALIACDSGNKDGGDICVRSDVDDTDASPTWWVTSQANNYLADGVSGGPHGKQFNDISTIANNELTWIELRAGNRVDAITARYSNGATTQRHGGGGGSATSLSLNPGEYINYASACEGSHNGTTRVFSLELRTNLGRVVSGGTPTSVCTSWSGKMVGFFGRSGDELDSLGPIFRR